MAAEQQPEGCIGCNPEPVRAALRAAGVDPDTITEIPAAPRHKWPDMLQCPWCERWWLLPTKQQTTESP